MYFGKLVKFFVYFLLKLKFELSKYDTERPIKLAKNLDISMYILRKNINDK